MKSILMSLLILLLILPACDGDEAADPAESTQESRTTETQQPDEPQPQESAAESDPVERTDILTDLGNYYADIMGLYNPTRRFMCQCGFAHQGTEVEESRCMEAMYFSDQARQAMATCKTTAASAGISDPPAAELGEFLDCGYRNIAETQACLTAAEESFGDFCAADNTQAVLDALTACDDAFTERSLACQADISREFNSWFSATWRRSDRAQCTGSFRLVAFPGPDALQ